MGFAVEAGEGAVERLGARGSAAVAYFSRSAGDVTVTVLPYRPP
ncbi:hypothetical protein [Streptomyces tritici]